MKLRRLSIDRMPGIDRPFEVVIEAHRGRRTRQAVVIDGPLDGYDHPQIEAVLGPRNSVDQNLCRVGVPLDPRHEDAAKAAHRAA